MDFLYNESVPRPTSSIVLTNFQVQVVLGTLLGDSSLSIPKHGKNYHLSCYHAIKQREWLTTKHSWLSPASRPIQWCAYIDKRDGKTRQGGRFHTVSIPQLTKLATLIYRRGRKIIDPLYLNQIKHPVALACLICDDGSWDGAGIGIASKQFTKRENRLLASWMSKRWGLTVTAMTTEKYPHIRIAAISVQRARDLCFEFTPKFLRYKFGPEDYKTRRRIKVRRRCKLCRTPFVCYESNPKEFCSRHCSARGKPSGYKTRTTTAPCEKCGRSFIVYTCRQTRCRRCRGKPLHKIPCVICGRSVKKTGRRACSPSCGVALGHRSRK